MKKDNKINLKTNLTKISKIEQWFNECEEIDVEEGLTKVKEAVSLIKETRKCLKEIENEFEEVKKELKD